MFTAAVPNHNLTKCVFFLERDTYEIIARLATQNKKSRSKILREGLKEVKLFHNKYS